MLSKVSRMGLVRRACAITIGSLLLSFPGNSGRALAAEEGNSPFIDELKREAAEDAGTSEESSKPGSFIAREREKLRNQQAESGEDDSTPYTRQLRSSLESATPAAEDGESWLQRQQRELKDAEDGADPSAISRFKSGRNELKAKKDEKIRYAASFHMAATTTRAVNAAAGAGTGQAFGDIYTQEMFPPIGFSFEYQPLRWEGVFSLGFGPSFDISSHRGRGTFAVDLGGTVGNTSEVEFRFVTVASGFNGVVRLDLLPVLQPWVSAGGAVLAYRESRNDDGDAHQGYSLGSRLAGGVNIRLDGVMDSSSWDSVTDLGLNHLYLSVSYARISSAGDQLRTSQESVFGGFTYEY